MINYEQKYKEALERLRALVNSAKKNGHIIVRTEDIEDTFPELNESEDEKIRKGLIENFKWFCGDYPETTKWGKDDDMLVKDIITWLEKQESVEEIVERCKTSWYNEGKIQGQIEGLSDDEKYQQGWHDALEKQGEQKETLCDKCKKAQPFHSCQDITALGRCYIEGMNTSNKVKPKFHEGDWVIDKQGIIHQIANVVENVTNHTYGYDIVGGGYFNDNTEGVRLWTIEDAKDGDVLMSNNGASFIYKKHDKDYVYSYCGINLADEFVKADNTDTWVNNNSKVCPATKEQCDTLFAKMKEEGYEWDGEKKKELKTLKE